MLFLAPWCGTYFPWDVTEPVRSWHGSGDLEMQPAAEALSEVLGQHCGKSLSCWGHLWSVSLGPRKGRQNNGFFLALYSL